LSERSGRDEDTALRTVVSGSGATGRGGSAVSGAADPTQVHTRAARPLSEVPAHGTQKPPAVRARSAAIADGLSFMARWSLRLALIGLGAALLWWVVAQLWVIVLPVLLALLIATVLAPPTTWLRRRGLPPALAASIVLLAGLLLLGLVVYFLATSIRGGVAEIAGSAVAGLQSVRDWIAGPPLNIGSTQFDALLDQVTQRLQSSVSTIAGSVLTGVGTLASLVVTGLLALVLAFLFVKDGDRFLPWLRDVVGPRVGGHLYVILGQIWAGLGGYIRGQVLVSLADGVLIGIGLLIVGVPLALPLAVLTFFGGFVPIVGALFAGVLSVLVALVSNGFTAALIVLGIVLLVQQIEGNVLQPILQGKSLQLHAAVVLLAVTAGGSLYGIAGAFLAVPVAATAAVVLRYLFAQIDRTSEDDSTDAPSDPVAAAAVGLPPAPDPKRAVADDDADRAGAVGEPRPDAPNPEQLEIADDPEPERSELEVLDAADDAVPARRRPDRT
jgi:predicted PurR-regulated permease PerM